MKKLYSLLILVVIGLNSIQAQDHRSGELIVMIKHDSDIELICEKLNSKLPGYAFAPNQKLGVSWDIWLISFDETKDHVLALKSVNNLNEVIMVQSNHKTELRSVIPNDTQFSSQWDMMNTGQNGGTVGADINATAAWGITTGGLTALGDTIVAAVIDGGADLNHPDLDFFKNYNEIPGNGIDDDNNGYIDDVSGWNAYNNTGVVPSNSHGTHVSGTIGAIGNNNLGVSGVNWNVKVLPIAGSSGNEATVVIAYSYVYEMRKLYNNTDGAKGAYIVSTNASFGVDYGQPANFPIWCAIYDSLGSVGVLNCGAGPNLNVNIDVVGDIPTACPSDYIISCTNTTRADAKNSGAGYGVINMDIGAPGTSILSTTPLANYGNSTGTSMATPHVTGAIALMYAAACDKMITDARSNPASIALQMRNYLLTGVDSISAMAGIVSSYGRLNLFKSLLNVQSYQCLPTSISAIESSNKSLVYPNPANEEIWYRPAVEIETGDVIEWTDLRGQIIDRSYLSTGSTTNNFYNIQFHNLSQGMYFLIHKRGTARLSVNKVIIQ